MITFESNYLSYESFNPVNQGSDICYGYLDQISFNGTVVYDVSTMNVRGQILTASIGGNAATWGYDSYGNITSSAASGIQGYTYTPNTTTGNLTSRSNSLKSLTENFYYDTSDRLDSVRQGSTRTLRMGYDTKGNITTKSDAGTLLYDLSGKPYAVGHVTPYTANFPADSLRATYTSFGKVNTLAYGPNTYSATFKYNADNERIKMVISQSGTVVKTKYYFGGSYEKVIEGATTTEYIWIGGDPYTAVAVAKIVNGGTPVVYAIFRDNLGTITHLKSSSETLEYSFDAYGRRRDKDDWSYTLTSEPVLFADRGFTGHEHLTQFGLINMNGRLYDPLVGRFLSPDNYIAAPGFTQAYNRYSYCLNNPLKFIDPSGNTYKPIYWDEAIGGGSGPSYGWDSEGGTGFWHRGDYYTPNGNGSYTGTIYSFNLGGYGGLPYYDPKTGSYQTYAGSMGYYKIVNAYTQVGDGDLVYKGTFRQFIPSTGGSNDPSGRGGEPLPSWLSWTNNGVNSAAYGAYKVGGTFRLAKSGSLSLGWYKSGWSTGNQYVKTTYSLTKLGTGVGVGTSIVGAVIGGINFGLSDGSWGDYGSLGISLLSAGLTLGGPTTPIGIGIGIIDAAGGFNGFYNYLDNQQQFYNSTGGIIVPMNSIPNYFQLHKP